MKLNLYACLVVGALAVATQAVAQPILSVDINGANTAGGQAIGPTHPDFQGWDVLAITDEFHADFGAANNWVSQAAAGMTKVFASTEGNVTATLRGTGASYSARNRGANMGGLTDLQQDFVFAQRDGAVAFGRNFLKLQLSGLIANKAYRFTGFAREAAFQGAELANPDAPGQSYQAWTSIQDLGGLDGPAAWLDANVSAGASYQPIWVPTDHDMDPNTPNIDVNTGYKNPIPTLDRSQIAGPDSLSQGNTFFHTAIFDIVADASGVATVYTWSDPNGFGSTVQGASLLNGFRIANVPEPASMALIALGLVGVASLRRRVR